MGCGNSSRNEAQAVHPKRLGKDSMDMDYEVVNETHMGNTYMGQKYNKLRHGNGIL